MLKLSFALAVVALSTSAVAVAQKASFANGNMMFDAKAIDTDGDHMISRDEFMKFGETAWAAMSNGADSIPVQSAAQDFARGNMRFSAKGMDANHDGKITKEEFMAYGAAKFDKMKDAKGMISVPDATKDFSRGNQPAG
jgi:hypothetical protein